MIVEEKDTVEVVEGEAPVLRVAVGEVVMVELEESVLLGVEVGVGVGEGVGLEVGVALPL